MRMLTRRPLLSPSLSISFSPRLPGLQAAPGLQTDILRPWIFYLLITRPQRSPHLVARSTHKVMFSAGPHSLAAAAMLCLPDPSAANFGNKSYSATNLPSSTSNFQAIKKDVGGEADIKHEEGA